MQQNPHVARAQMLLSQNRTELAEQELHQALAEEPNDWFSFALLGLCQGQLEKYEQATQAAQQAIHLAPDMAFPHYSLAYVLLKRNRPPEALQQIDEALRIEPEEPQYYEVRAAILLQLARWKEALSAAEQGLAIDPEDADLLNYKSIAQIKLGMQTGAEASIEAAMRRQPENALSHANLGWAKLEAGKHREAMESFREALRLDPEDDWARRGILESMRARNPLYRVMLRYFLWMSKFTERGQWLFIIGFYLLYRLVSSVAANNADLAPFLWPLVYLYVAFAILTWVSVPLMNLILRFDRFGKLVLSTAEKRTAEAVGGLLFLAFGALAGFFLTGHELLVITAMVFGFMVVPVSQLHKCDRGWPWWTGLGYTAVMGILGLTLVAGPFVADFLLGATGKPEDWLDSILSTYSTLITVYILLAFGSQFLFNYLASHRVRY